MARASDVGAHIIELEKGKHQPSKMENTTI